MRIQTLGGLSARSDAGLLGGEAAQPRRLALLALLARAGDRGISRDKVVGFLWPETGEERARRTLSQALYSLRQGMGCDDLFLGTQELRLNPAVVTTDVAEFTAARREGNWERAAELYAGPFLDGFHLPGTAEFERWVESEREAIGHEYADVLERLAVRADQGGEFRAAVGWWRKLAALDPLNARLATALMRSLAAAGDRGAAIRHAQVYQALVEQELDVPADREVVVLAERIRAEPAPVVEPALAPVTPGAAELLPAAPASAVPVEPPPVVPAPAPSRWSGRHQALGGVALAIVATLAVGAVFALRGRDQATPAAGLPLLMVGRITDYGGGSTGGVGRPLADMIATDLAQAPQLRVISTARVYELLAQLGASDTATAGLMSAARHAGATEMLDGALFDLGGGRIRLDLRRVDVATGAVLGAYSVQGSDPFGLADSVTARLVADLGISAAGGLIAAVTTRSLPAYRAYEAGLRDYFRRDFAAAEKHFADALQADSSFAMATYYHAYASPDPAVRLARLDDARRRAAHASDRERLIITVAWAQHNAAPNGRALAETLAVRYPDEVDGHLALGLALYADEDFPGGIRSFARVVAMDSLGLRGGGVRCAACDAFANLITGHAMVDSMDAALRVARSWSSAQPDNPAAWRSLAILSDRRGDSAAASLQFRRARSLDTSSAGAHWDRTTRWWIAEQYGEVERADFKRLTAGVPESERLDLLWDLMLARANQGRFEAALETATVIRRVVAAAGQVERDGHPHAIIAGLAEAQALRQAGRLSEAIARLDSLARFDRPASAASLRASTRVWILTHLGSALGEAGDTARLAVLAARMDSLKGLSGQRKDLKYPRYVRGLLEAARGRDEAASIEFAHASFRALDGFGPATLERARAAMRLGRPLEAVTLLQQLRHGSYHFHYTRAELHEALAEAWSAAGRRDSARVHLRALARAWAGADPPVQARLARLQQRMDAPHQ